MACDACNKMTGDLQGLSEHMLRYLPFRYAGARICYTCTRKLDDYLDAQRALAWQRTALKVVDMIDEARARGAR